ncbi:DNA helicase/exodeoxyribonuclease V, subunit B [Granulicatella balaenopterae]|uniref:DNA helicase/exodeoxyribonuclease V, subunit B n=1 Tax=Granulicatella balaenopterae TaxID=137733 RepID=A0A1H9NP48_9LACT|nr:PD-(D/E)XK nuclease family protein [Granulicatella balaenopterae]SER37726.1 DNA helicase/exodeoxyribonuclease V, subunit B [Granulicatella balaenopterae]
MGFERLIKTETTNHHQVIVREMTEWLQKDPENQVFYLIPDHIKFTAEIDMIKQTVKELRPHASQWAATRLQVFSFNRLAWYLLKENPIAQKPGISKVGLGMIIQKILMTHQEELVLFRHEIHHQGFIEQLVDIFMEFRQGGIEPEDFAVFINHEEVDTTTDAKQRMKEFGILYRYFQQELVGNYIAMEEVLQTAASVIRELDFRKTLVIIDHHYSFKAGELEILAAFTECASRTQLYTSLSMDALKDGQDSQSLYYSNYLLLQRVTDFLADYGHYVQATVEVKNGNSLYNDDFKQLEAFWLSSNKGIKKPYTASKQEIDCLSVVRYDSHKEELQETVAHIHQLVHSGQYRYQDIQLVTRTLEADSLLLEPLLRQYKIPYFIDLTDTMDKHPLLQLIESIFAIKKHFWRYSDILALLRSELAFWPIQLMKELKAKEDAEELEDLLEVSMPSEIDLVLDTDELEASPEELLNRKTQAVEEYRARVDLSENVILANGYQGRDWVSNKPWYYQPEAIDEDSVLAELSFDEYAAQTAAQLREVVTSHLQPFFKQLDEPDVTSKQAMSYLFQLLEEIGVYEATLYWRDIANEKGNIGLARKHEQTWNEFIRIVDEYVAIFGETPFQLDQFLQLLRTGFTQTHYSMAPTTLDQLICTGIDALQYNPKKISFVIGATQGNLPKLYENKTLFTDEERDLLTNELDSGRFLRPSSAQQQTIEPFVFYKLLVSATEHVYFSYAQILEDSSTSQEMSSYLERLRLKFDFPIIDGSKRKQERFERHEFYTDSELYMHLLEQYRKYHHDLEAMPREWAAIAKVLAKNSTYKERYQQLIQSVFRYNVPDKLPKELAESLYGKNLYLSISQVELFNLDSFGHFLRYGLKLEERREFELTIQNAGNYFHDAMDLFVQYLSQRQLLIENLSQAEIDQILTEILAQQDEKQQYIILSSSKRMEFIRSLLQDTIKTTAHAMQQQQKQLLLKPFATELVFGPGSPYQVTLPLNQMNHTLSLRGKIDRIDYAHTSVGDFISVLDYKSGKKDFNMDKFMAGLQLQLFVYLSVSQKIVQEQTHKNIVPFGAFYMHLHQPKFKHTDLMKKVSFEELWLKDFSYKGLMATDESLISILNPLENDEPSLVLPYGLKKNGDFTKASKVVTREELELMMDYAYYQVKETGKRILDGDIRLSPYKGENFTPSVNGIYTPISQFDATLPENQYIIPKKKSKEAYLEEMALALEDDEEIKEMRGDTNE